MGWWGDFMSGRTGSSYSLAPNSFQITRFPTGSTRVPPEKSAARTPSTRSWSWRKSSSLTPTWPGTEGTRWRGCSTSPRDRLKSGSRTAGWRWRSSTKTARRKTNKKSAKEQYWGWHAGLCAQRTLFLTPLSHCSILQDYVNKIKKHVEL